MYKGVVKCRVVSIRFASSGKVASVHKFISDKVKKWDLIASLDRKIHQTELDRELADYERVRADFEIFAAKYPNPEEAVDKYLKTEKQALLNASVKNVELVKASLDQCDLFSPIDGIVIDDNGIVPGIFVTPASSEIKILDTNSFYIELEIEQKDLQKFTVPHDAKIKIDGLDKELFGKTSQVYTDLKKFLVKIPISNPDLLPGLSAEVTL